MTIKGVLARITAVVVLTFVIMIGLGAAFFYEEGDTAQGKQAIADLGFQLRDLNVELLQARRNEKDFILRREDRYAERHAETVARTMAVLTEIKELQRRLDVAERTTLTDEISEGWQRYADQFSRLVQLNRQIGLQPDLGFEGQLRTAVQSIEALLADVGNFELTTKMLMMRRHEKDFIMRVDQRYVDRLNARVSEFQAFPASAFGSQEVAGEAQALLLVYQAAFMSLAQATIDALEARQELSQLYVEVSPLVTELKTVADAVAASKTEAYGETQHFFMTTAIAIILVSVLSLFIVMQRSSRSISTPLMAYAQALDDVMKGRDIKDLPMSKIAEIGQISQAVETLGRNEEERRLLQGKAEEAQKQQEIVTDALRDSLERLAGGDLQWRIEIALDGGYETLRSDYNDAVEKLRSAMLRIFDHSGSIRNRAKDFTHATGDLSHRTESQAASLEETVAAIDELSESVKSSAEKSSEVYQFVKNARAQAELANDVVSKTIDAMDEIEGSSTSISRIIGVIDDIAFQTNLLALNAGVEAARAGEAGLGFAVVASEVRALAQRSSEAANEIKSLISASSQHVSRGVDSVGKTGNVLTEIVGMVKHINELVADIAKASNEQSASLNEINAAMNQLDQVTQQNAAMVDETTAASLALTKDAEDLENLTSGFQLGSGDVSAQGDAVTFARAS